MEGKVVMKIKSYTGRVIKSKGDEKNVKLSKNCLLYTSQTPQVYIECKENEKKGKLNITWTVAEGSYKREFIEEAFTSYCTSIEEYFKSLFIENGSSIKLSQLQSSYLYSRRCV